MALHASVRLVGIRTTPADPRRGERPHMAWGPFLQSSTAPVPDYKASRLRREPEYNAREKLSPLQGLAA